jgi:hypothetical protein
MSDLIESIENHGFDLALALVALLTTLLSVLMFAIRRKRDPKFANAFRQELAEINLTPENLDAIKNGGTEAAPDLVAKRLDQLQDDYLLNNPREDSWKGGGMMFGCLVAVGFLLDNDFTYYSLETGEHHSYYFRIAGLVCGAIAWFSIFDPSSSVEARAEYRKWARENVRDPWEKQNLQYAVEMAALRNTLRETEQKARTATDTTPPPLAAAVQPSGRLNADRL